MRLSLYDNAHHLPPGKLEELERLYPKTHAKYRSLILGLRGPNITGPPVYDGAFNRDFHVRVIPYDPSQPLLEGFHAGGKHPTWVAAQRSGMGSFRVLGGVIGKRLFLDSFLPMIDQKREEWFGSMTTSLYCADPPPSSEEGFRFTALTALRGHGYQKVRFRPNGNAPDTRESVIQNIGGLMQRRFGAEQAFGINADPARFLMVSLDVVKPTSYFVDSCEGSYVWDDNLVSVANKKIQQPKYDQWIEGWQRCMENIVLNFCAGPIKKAGPPNPRQLFPQQEPLTGPMGWAS